MNNRANLRLAPVFLALALFLSGCGQLGPTPRVEPDQTLSGGVLNGAPAWKAALPATLAPLPTATAANIPTALPDPTATPITPPTLVPTETPPSLALDPACLLGSWETANLAQAIGESLAVSGGSLALEGVEGRAHYRFHPDGRLEIFYQGLSAFFVGTVDGRQVRVAQTLDGFGSAQYTVDPTTGEILLSGFGGDGIQSSLAINGQVLAEGSLPVWQAFAAGMPEQDPAGQAEVITSRTAATCQGDSLTLQAVDPAPGPVVQLFRAP